MCGEQQTQMFVSVLQVYCYVKTWQTSQGRTNFTACTKQEELLFHKIRFFNQALINLDGNENQLTNPTLVSQEKNVWHLIYWLP